MPSPRRRTVPRTAVQNRPRSPSDSRVSFSRHNATGGSEPSRLSRRSTSRAMPVIAAADGPLPHTSPIVIPHPSSGIGNTS